MKHVIIIFCILTLCLGLSHAIDVPHVKNPDKPVKADAGRTVELEEVMQITDEEGDFFFKRPNRIKIAVDGSIYLADDKQLLRFDAGGKFLKNLQTKGEGPGEFVWIRNYFLTPDKVVIYTGQPAKIIQMDLKGKLLNEKRLKGRMGFHRVLAFDKDKFWSGGATPPDFSKVKTGTFTIDRQLWNEPLEGEPVKTGIMFPEEAYMEKKSIKGGGVSLRMNISVPAVYTIDKKDFYVCNSQAYKIKRIDLSKPQLVQTFNRPYKSLVYVKQKEEEGSRTLGPTPELFNDVQRIRLFKDQVWVFTSTVDKEKGVLVDVFSRDGKYLDYFYLRLPQVEDVYQLRSANMSFHKEFIFMTQKDEEENSIVVKYRLK